jgi:VanZ family protein
MPSKLFSLNKIKPSFIPAIAWLILSIILLTLPGSSFPKENWFDKIWLDKWIHIGMFAIMVILWCWAMLKKNPDGIRLRTLFIWIGLASLAYGIGMEFVQKYFIPNRSFDVGDIIADGFGCTLGVIYSSRRYVKK